MPDEVCSYIAERQAVIREIRMRIGRPVQVISEEDRLIGRPVDGILLRKTLDILTDFSLYSREEEMKDGYFSLKDGSRVGVCGKYACAEGEIVGISQISSVSIRIRHEIKGCAEKLIKLIQETENICSALIYSPPGMGKTTMLRDVARILSGTGYRVGIIDERHEIAACVDGFPSLDVGMRTDVMEGLPKSLAVGKMVRAMSPDVIITDEIGSDEDAEALSEAARCGVKVIASAHGGCFKDLLKRKSIGDALLSGVFDVAVGMSGTPGRISEVVSYSINEEGMGEWRSELRWRS
ncbi:MAG: stage III sporulation protein AA [Clostridiales bacterium]|nr:stage III sporulation protein AA [Clostridiales bacterium]